MKKYFLLTGALIVLTLTFLLLSIFFGTNYTPDSYEYIIQAFNIRNYFYCYSGDINHEFNPFYLSLRPPGYSLFINFCYFIANSDWSVLIIQNLLFVTVFILLYQITNKYLDDKRRILIITTSIIFFPIAICMNNYILSDNLLMVLTFCAFVCMIIFLNSNKDQYLFIANVILCFSAFVKPIFQYFWIVNLIFTIYLIIKNKKWKRVYISILILPFCVSLWSYRNYMHTGVFHFSSISMQVLPLHYAKDVLSFGYGPYFADSTFNDFVRKQSLIPSFKEKFQISIDFSTSIIKEHSMLFLVKHLRGLFSFFLDNGRHFIYESVGYIPKNEVSFLYLLDSKGWIKGTIMYFGLLNAFEIAIISFIFLWNVISLVMLIVYPFARNEKIEIKIFLLLIIWYVANFSTFTNYARFKVCVFPLLVYIIIVSLDFLLKYKLHFDAKQPIKKITIAY